MRPTNHGLCVSIKWACVLHRTSSRPTIERAQNRTIQKREENAIQPFSNGSFIGGEEGIPQKQKQKKGGAEGKSTREIRERTHRSPEKQQEPSRWRHRTAAARRRKARKPHPPPRGLSASSRSRPLILIGSCNAFGKSWIESCF